MKIFSSILIKLIFLIALVEFLIMLAYEYFVPLRALIEKYSLLGPIIDTSTLVLIITIAYYWSLKKPLNEFIKIMSAIGKGDFSKKANDKRKDELGKLATSFNQMTQELQTANEELRTSEEELKSTNEELQSANEEMASTNEELRATTEELQKEKGFAKVIAENIQEGVMLLSKDFKVIWANKKIMDSTGLKEENVLGGYCYKLTHHLDEPCKPPHDTCPVLEVLKTGKPVIVTHIHFDKEGNKFYAEVSAYPVKNEKGWVVQFIHVTRDITERVKLEEELKKKVFDLERFNKLSVGRELEMKKLKARIAELEGKLSGKS